jgi:hypothetical protein
MKPIQIPKMAGAPDEHLRPPRLSPPRAQADAGEEGRRLPSHPGLHGGNDSDHDPSDPPRTRGDDGHVPRNKTR